MEDCRLKKRDHEGELRKLLSSSPDTIPLFAQMRRWNAEDAQSRDDDRETVIVSFVFLEDALKLLLAGHFSLIGTARAARLFDSNGGREPILGNVYNRSMLAQCLDLISDQCRKDLLTLSLIRNTFAHTGFELNFSHPSLVALSELETLRSLGQTHEFHDYDGTRLFDIHLKSPRSKVLGFIMMFWLFCVVRRETDQPRMLSDIFAPKLPLLDRQVIRVLTEDEAQAIKDRVNTLTNKK